MYNSELEGTFYGPGLAQENIEVTFPFSSNIAMIAGWDHPFPPYLNVSEKVCEEMNKRIIMYAEELLISSKPDFIGSHFIKKKQKI